MFHLDVKPENILVNERGVPKLSDFGLAQYKSEIDEKQKKNQKFIEGWTKLFSAYEILKGQRPLFSSDLWSLAASMVYLFGHNTLSDHILLRSVFTDPENTSNAEFMLRIRRDQAARSHDKVLSALLRKMSIVLPEKRPSVEDVLTDTVVSKVLKDWEMYTKTGVINKEKGQKGQFSRSFLENHEDVLSCLEIH